MSHVRAAVFIAAGALLILSMLPNYFLGEIPGISVPILGAGVVLMLLPAANRPLHAALGRWYRPVSLAGYILTAAALLVMAVLTLLMLSAARNTAVPEGTDVVVPGSAILGDQPRPMLRSRLNAACAYLESHPGTRVVVTGGRYGTYTQAEVEKKYLVSKGIDASRILVDDRSNTTYENMVNAHRLLGVGKIAVATDVYHQFRAQQYARQVGMTAYALPSRTPLNHTVDSWVREYIGIVKAFLLHR